MCTDVLKAISKALQHGEGSGPGDVTDDARKGNKAAASSALGCWADQVRGMRVQHWLLCELAGKGVSTSSCYTSPARSLCRSNKSTLVPKGHHQANLGKLCSCPEPVPDVAASQHVQGMGEQLKTTAQRTPHTR